MDTVLGETKLSECRTLEVLAGEGPETSCVRSEPSGSWMQQLVLGCVAGAVLAAFRQQAWLPFAARGARDTMAIHAQCDCSSGSRSARKIASDANVGRMRVMWFPAEW